MAAAAICYRLLARLLTYENTLAWSSSAPILEPCLLDAMAWLARVMAFFIANFYWICDTTSSYIACSLMNSLRPGLSTAWEFSSSGIGLCAALDLVDRAWRRWLALRVDLFERWLAWLLRSINSWISALPVFMDFERTVEAKDTTSAWYRSGWAPLNCLCFFLSKFFKLSRERKTQRVKTWMEIQPTVMALLESEGIAITGLLLA